MGDGTEAAQDLESEDKAEIPLNRSCHPPPPSPVRTMNAKGAEDPAAITQEPDAHGSRGAGNQHSFREEEKSMNSEARAQPREKVPIQLEGFASYDTIPVLEIAGWLKH